MNKGYAIFILGFFFIIACNIKRAPIKHKLNLPSNSKELISSVRKTNISPEWLSLKGKMSLEGDNEKISCTVNVQIRRDSAIWISLRGPVLGLEIARTVLNKDSIIYMNMLNATYNKYAISYINNKIGQEISYKKIQDIFFGVPQIVKGKYSFKQDNYTYSIFSKDNKKGNIMYKVDKNNLRIVEAQYIYNSNKNWTLILSDYSTIQNNYQIPNKLFFKFKNPTKISLNLNFTKAEVNKPHRLNFIIPKNYVKQK
tara:strand:- start:14853 stop:15617 length:765 start_codon:yes stop_codon:yes gene_type:complete